MSDRATVLLAEPGIYDRIAADDYHADPCREPSLSASIAHIICAQSPAHAKHAHPRLNASYRPDREDKFDLGTAAHAIFLENDPSRVAVIDAPDYRTNAAKDARDLARAQGRTPILSAQMNRVHFMLEALKLGLEEHQDGCAMFRNGRAEQTLVWFDDEFGVWCRARADYLRPGAIDDLKCSANANPEFWSRQLFGLGADIQACFYLTGLKKLTGCEAVFRFAVVEAEPPHAVSVLSLGPDAMTLAEKRVRYSLQIFRECLDSGRWPGYEKRTCHISLPTWVESQWLERELR